MGKIKGWTKIWDSKNIIRYQSDKSPDEKVEIFSARINGFKKWFVAYIDKSGIHQFQSTSSGVSKREAQKRAVDWMMVN